MNIGVDTRHLTMMPGTGGAHLAVDVVIGACPTAFPATVHVAVAVIGGDAAARAETLVLVQGS